MFVRPSLLFNQGNDSYVSWPNTLSCFTHPKLCFHANHWHSLPRPPNLNDDTRCLTRTGQRTKARPSQPLKRGITSYSEDEPWRHQRSPLLARTKHEHTGRNIPPKGPQLKHGRDETSSPKRDTTKRCLTDQNNAQQQRPNPSGTTTSMVIAPGITIVVVPGHTEKDQTSKRCKI